MAEKTATEKTQNVTSQKATNAMLARRLKAVQDNGHMTPKMMRGFDRLAASIANSK